LPQQPRGRRSKATKSAAAQAPPGSRKTPQLRPAHRLRRCPSIRSVPQGLASRRLRTIRAASARRNMARSGAPGAAEVPMQQIGTGLPQILLQLSGPALHGHQNGSRRWEGAPIHGRLQPVGSDAVPGRWAVSNVRRGGGRAAGAVEQHQRAPVLFWIGVLHFPETSRFPSERGRAQRTERAKRSSRNAQRAAMSVRQKACRSP